MLYWKFLLNLKTSLYFLIRIKNSKKKLIHSKYQRINLKKIVIKSKSFILLKKIKLFFDQSDNIPINIFTNLLNLYGINAQKFSEDFCTLIKQLNLINCNFSVIIFLFKDLSYRFVISNIKYNFLIKNVYLNLKMINNNLFLNKLLYQNVARFNSVEIGNNRNYFLTDLYSVLKFFGWSSFYFIEFNVTLNNFFFLESNLPLHLSIEKLINNFKSILKSFNVQLKFIKLIE